MRVPAWVCVCVRAGLVSHLYPTLTRSAFVWGEWAAHNPQRGVCGVPGGPYAPGEQGDPLHEEAPVERGGRGARDTCQEGKMRGILTKCVIRTQPSQLIHPQPHL
jgi:hypothetical protein